MLLAAITLAGFWKVVTFLIMLSILVVLHELGHFVVARRNGVKVNEFAVGMGPKIVGWTNPRTGTLFSLRALPIGGYCAMEGEDGKTSEAEQQREYQASLQTGAPAEAPPPLARASFQAKTSWQRLAIVLAGPIANFVLCYLILVVGAVAFGVQGEKAQPVVGQLIAGWPAEAAGIHPGDRIVELNGVPVTDGTQLVDTIHASLGQTLTLVYERDGVRKSVNVVPRKCDRAPIADKACLGFTPVPIYQRVGLGAALVDSADSFVRIADSTVGSIALLVTNFREYAPQVSGVIGMGQAAATVQDFGWGPYFSLAAMISFALGLFNLLPIPALDGGRAAFIIAEMVRGKPVDPEKEALVHVAGFAALMALMLLVAFHDLTRLFSGKGVM